MTDEKSILVSIIIPVYNVEAYIRNCLDSVFNQTYKDIEVLIIDDRGVDNSMNIVYKCKEKSPYNIKIITHNKNKGLSAARNSGIKEASGEYIYFLDSDDTLPNNAIELLMEKVKHFGLLDFVMGEFNIIGSDKSYPLKIDEYINENEKIFTDYLKYKWFIMACNKLIRKDFIINNNIFFIEGILHEDEEFSFKLALKANLIAACRAYTYNYIIRPNSITQNKKVKNFEDQLFIIDKNFSSIVLDGMNKEVFNVVSIYLVNSIYSFIASLLKEGRFSNKEKKELRNKSLSIYKKYSSYNKLNVKAIIKKILILLPFKLQVYIFNILYNKKL